MAMIVTVKKAPPIKLTGRALACGLYRRCRRGQDDVGKFLAKRQRNQSRFPESYVNTCGIAGSPTRSRSFTGRNSGRSFYNAA